MLQPAVGGHLIRIQACGHFNYLEALVYIIPGFLLDGVVQQHGVARRTSKSHWSKRDQWSGSVRSSGAFQGANLQGAMLQGANFNNVNLQAANLQSANLSGDNLSGATTRGVITKGSNSCP